MTETIRQEVVLAASPARVFRALTESAGFASLTGAPAEIDATAGGAFSCFGGMIIGRQLELVPGERIVQAWRVKVWEPGVFSLVRFDLHADGAGTRATLVHSGFPEGQAEHLAKGWHTNYWEPLAKLAR